MPDAKAGSTALQQLVIRLPEELARRLKRRVPARARSAFIRRLLEQALPDDEGEDDPLYQVALSVEHKAHLCRAGRRHAARLKAADDHTA